MKVIKLNRLVGISVTGRLWFLIGLGCLMAGLILPGGAPNLCGQAITSASINGSVMDSSGAAVPGAAVTLSDPTRSITRHFTTESDGRYFFTLIPPGTYTLHVEKAGFRAYRQTGIELTIGVATTRDVSLEVGALTQEVQVTASAATLNTSNANIGTTLSSRQVTELPLSQRHVLYLVFVDSSVNNVAGHTSGADAVPTDDDGWNFQFGGRRPSTVTALSLLDGHAITEYAFYVPGLDEIAEFKVQPMTFSAQYGWSQGNVINIITKSGTNKFHGSLFEFNRINKLAASNFMSNKNGLPKPGLIRNQFGFTAGGPLWIPKLYERKDKTFIFGGWEGLRNRIPVTEQTTVPTADMKSGDFSALLGEQLGTDALGRPYYVGEIYDPFTTRQVTGGQVDPVTGLTVTGFEPGVTGYIRDPFAGNIIPTGRFDSVSSNLLQYWVAPNRSGLTNNLVANSGSPTNSDRYSVRVDHNISDKSRLFTRWAQSRLAWQIGTDLLGPNNPAGPGTMERINALDFGLGYTRTFSPTLVMSINAGWVRKVENWRPSGAGFNPSTLGFPTNLPVGSVFPGIGVDGVLGLGAGDISKLPEDDRSVAVDFTKIHGSHTLNMGFMSISLDEAETAIKAMSFGFDRSMTGGPDPTAGVPDTGYGFASFLLGTGGGSVDTQAEPMVMKHWYGWYLQDDWKVTRKLTLNLGVRYDFQTAPTERFDRITIFKRTEPNPLTGVVPSQYTDPDGNVRQLNIPGYLTYVGDGNRRGNYTPQYTNIAPRIGLGYQITDRLVMRAGFGMFYSSAIYAPGYQGMSLYGFSTSTPMNGSLDGITPYDLLSDPFPNGLIQPVGKADGTLTQIGQGLNAFVEKRPTPYVEQWMLSFAYALTPNDTLDLYYMGNHGVKLNSKRSNANQLTHENQALGTAQLEQVDNPFYGHIASSGCGLDQPTITWGQLLRPYPQYCDVLDRQQPGFSSWYHALQINYGHRWSQGLHMFASFTWSKYLSNSTGIDQNVVPGNWSQLDTYDRMRDKSLDHNDFPKSLVISSIYQLPFGRGKRLGGNMNKFTNAVLGGWQVSGIASFKDGFPLAIGAASNNSGSRGGSQRPDCVGDPNIANPTADMWLNTAAFTQPAAYTFGNCPRTMPNLRNMGINNWDLNLEKNWNWGEKARIEFRGEFYNVFNRTYLTRIDQTFGSSTFGQAFEAAPARSIQFGLKVYW